MTLDKKLQARLERALSVVDEHGTPGSRLVDDARRLWARVRKLAALGLVTDPLDLESLELAVYAMQLPARRMKPQPTGRPGRSSLRDRAEEAAELLIAEMGAEVDELLLDRATRVLHEMPHRSPMLDESRLLADAVGLDDFGIAGLVGSAILLCRQGGGLTQLADGLEKREQYGYWDARLKDGFHFAAVRDIARRRLDHARQAAALLKQELAEDQP